MSSENLGLVALGVTLFAINAFLGAPIASRIARFFGKVLPSDAHKASDDIAVRPNLASGVRGGAAVAPPERPSSGHGRAA